MGEADTLIALGVVRHRSGDYARAVADLTLAMRLHGEIGNRLREASALHTLGHVQQRTGDHRTAMASLVRAREMYCELGDPLGEAHASTAISELHRELGDNEAALADHDRARKLFERIGHPKAGRMTRIGTMTSGPVRNPQAGPRKSARQRVAPPGDPGKGR
ncbi:tetratricopeptide repeat protein [Nonomuraea sp. B19D2]|uniref:tetratricopeptide repeat protein n=1 Tax=Nonomuraea sp. B19D2 TaxID=3159561 RepID=UPI0032DB2982